MNDNHSYPAKPEPWRQDLPECPLPGEAMVSPLGWSIRERLLCAAVAAALLWLAVAWALGWF